MAVAGNQPLGDVRQPMEGTAGVRKADGRHSWHAAVNALDADIATLPPKTGTPCALGPPRTSSASCVPPPAPEPLLPPQVRAEEMQRHDAARATCSELLINRLVFDSLLPPEPSEGTTEDGRQQAAGPDCCSFSYSPGLRAWYQPSSPNDTTLVFESRFETGNLRRAVQVYEDEYDLVLQPDINTRSHTQWYFFAVSNTRAGRRYKFNIINLMKEDSLYSLGMQPLVHSERDAALSDRGWHRDGSRICYYPNGIKLRRQQVYCTLTFTLEAAHDLDVLHVAHCYPYTYTDLQRYLQELRAAPELRPLCQIQPLCVTLAGNVCDVLTITNPVGPAAVARAMPNGRHTQQQQQQHHEQQQQQCRRKVVVISARVHPGESNASWMMQGVLRFLTGPSPEAVALRDAYIFKLVPMLNPDGVVVGNYRCNLAGFDLNRVWEAPEPGLHPTIWYMKDMMKQLAVQHEVALFCDLHGHSRKQDVFMYGCRKTARDAAPFAAGWPTPGSLGGRPGVPPRLQEKLLPLLLQARAGAALFNFHSCNFRVQPSKAGSSRVVVFRELGLVNSYTMEASFCGPSTAAVAASCGVADPAAAAVAGTHFSTADLEAVGVALCRCLLDYWDADRPTATEAAAQLERMFPDSSTVAAAAAAAPRRSSHGGQATDARPVASSGDEEGEEADADSTSGDCTDSDDDSSEDEALAAGLAARAAVAAGAASLDGGIGGGSSSSAAGDGGGYRAAGGGDGWASNSGRQRVGSSGTLGNTYGACNPASWSWSGPPPTETPTGNGLPRRRSGDPKATAQQALTVPGSARSPGPAAAASSSRRGGKCAAAHPGNAGAAGMLSSPTGAVAGAAAAPLQRAGGGGTKKLKKPRCKARASPPMSEYLLAERAKADAHLAHTLPLLGAAAAVAAEQRGVPEAGAAPGDVRRERRRSSGNSTGVDLRYFDSERYNKNLVAERRNVSGFLGWSDLSHGDAGEGQRNVSIPEESGPAAVQSPPLQQQHPTRAVKPLPASTGRQSTVAANSTSRNHSAASGTQHGIRIVRIAER